MKPMCAIVLAIAAPAAHAQLLVTPTQFTAQHAYTLSWSDRSPSGQGDLQLGSGPTTGLGGSSGSMSSSNGNLASGNGSRAEDFFRVFGGALVNRVHFNGESDALARLGPAATITSSASGIASSQGRFTVTTQVRALLFGSISVPEASALGGGSGSVSAGVRLTRLGVIDVLDQTLQVLQPGVINIQMDTLLDPGTYLLSAWASSSAIALDPGASFTSRGRYDVTVEFSAVPSPGAALPLAALGLVTRGRRR
jgi:hypothetical protein